MTVKGNLTQTALVLTLAGEIDDSKAQALRTEIDRLIEGGGAPYRVVFDFSKVSFMDSTGIGILLGRYKKYRGAGHAFYIMNPNLACDKLFLLSGIYQVIKKIGNLGEIA